MTDPQAALRCPQFGPMLDRWQWPASVRFARGTVIDSNPDIAVAGLQAAVLKHWMELFRFLAARRVPKDEAEDILQDLFVKVRTLESGPVAEPRAYLYKMTANLLFDRRRTAARRTARESLWAEVHLGQDKEIDESPSADQALAARDELAHVSKAIAALPPRTIDILRRYRIEGHAQRRIAADLEISLSAVEKHLQRAYRAVVAAQAEIDADIEVPRRSEAVE
jgi:RNA polymerase sigma-70 factor (ECF subfamily)